MHIDELSFSSHFHIVNLSKSKILVWFLYLINVSGFYEVIHSFIFYYHSFFVKLRKELLFFEKTLKIKAKRWV